MEVESLNNTYKTWMCGSSRCKEPEPVETGFRLPRSAVAVRKNSHRTYGGVLRKQRSRSSPVRSGVSGANSPVRHALSPSTSALRAHAPPPATLTPNSTLYNYNADAPGAVAFYAPHPPSTPIYLVPLALNPTQIHIIKRQQKQAKIKESKRVARHIVRSILRSILRAVAVATAARAGATSGSSVGAAKTDKVHHPYRSIASQTIPQRQSAEVDMDDISSSSAECSVACNAEGCEWAGDVRALRDSHVRLVLRQLEQLRDIERLNRALHRAHIPPASRPQAEPACLL